MAGRELITITRDDTVIGYEGHVRRENNKPVVESSIPVLYFGGLSEFRVAYPLAIEIALPTRQEDGPARTIYLADFRHRHKTKRESREPHKPKLKIAYNLAEVALADKPKGKLILLGRSEGAILAAKFAEKYPDIVAALLLLNPAGLVGPQSKAKITGHVLQEISGDVVQLFRRPRDLAIMLKGGRDTLIYGISDLKRTAEEVDDIVNADITDPLRRLPQNRILRAIIWGKYDQIFRLNEMKVTPDMFDVLYLVNGDHFSVNIDPKSEDHRRFVVLALHLLEQRLLNQT